MTEYQVVEVSGGREVSNRIMEDDDAQEVLAGFFASEGEPGGRAIMVRRSGHPDSVKHLLLGTPYDNGSAQAGGFGGDDDRFRVRPSLVAINGRLV